MGGPIGSFLLHGSSIRNAVLRHLCLARPLVRPPLFPRFGSSARLEDHGFESSTIADIFKGKGVYNASSICCSEFDQLDSKMCHLAESGQVSEALKVLNSMAFSNRRASVSDYNRLLKCYVKSRCLSLDKLLCIYFGLRERGLLPNAVTYNALFKGLIFIDSLRDALIVVVEMHMNGYLPSFKRMSKLLEKFLERGNFKDSVYIVEMMLLLDYSPAENVLIMIIGSSMLDEACRFFNMLLCKGHFCYPIVYNPILWALCKCDHSVVALSYMCSMKKRGFVHNIYSYTALVYVFSKNGEFDDVGRVLSEMDSVGCKLNVVTYTIIVQHLCENGKIKEAFGVLESMEKDGCEPNMALYNVTLRVLSQRNDLVGIDDMLSWFGTKGLTPNPYTYTALAGGMVKAGNVDDAYKLLVDAISTGCEIDVAGFNVYIHTLVLTNRSIEALSVVEKMREVGNLVPNNITYRTLLKGLCSEGHIEEALEILDKFGDGPNLLDTLSFNTLLSAASKLGDSSIVIRVWKKMQCQGIKLDVVSFTCLIQHFCSIGQISECYNLLQYMLNDGISPSTRTLNVFIHGVYKKRLLRVDQAQKIFTIFRNMGALPNSITYNIFIQAALGEGADDVAKEFVLEMYRQGVKPDIVTFRILIKSLCAMGEISVAFKRLSLLFEAGLAPDVAMYNIVLASMLQRGMLGDAVLLLKHMASHGCEPNIISAKIIDRAILKGRMKGFPHAKELVAFVRCIIVGNQQRNFC